MNILIADSGATKTEWVLVHDNGEMEYYHTDGLNPYFMSTEQLISVIDTGLRKAIEHASIDAIYFYGAGCGSEANKEIVRNAISACFTGSLVYVDTDILAAAKACFGNKPGVACILGTGSNSCLYDGDIITKKIVSLGFTLGDEGSGGYFGKQILRSYFYKYMPQDLRHSMEEHHDMRLEIILEKVYKQPTGNRFVASFSQILGEFPDHPFIQEIVRNGFIDFADNQLTYFGDITNQPIGFVGSVAAIHKEILGQVLSERGLNLEIIIRKPIERLVQYHLERRES